MKTKKITLLISILFTFVIFAAPAFAYDADSPVLWWDVLDTFTNGEWVGDLEYDTEVTLAAGETLRANLYVSGIDDPKYGIWSVDGNITYANSGMFDAMTINDTHLHFDFMNLRSESVTPSGTIYQRGGYDLNTGPLVGDNKLILGEYDFMGSMDFVGVQLTANATIDPYANITLNIDENFTMWSEGFLLPETLNLTINPVPVPAAVWLIGSAMLCILGINQRKKN